MDATGANGTVVDVRTIPRWGYATWCTPDDDKGEAALVA